jgi:hypothetical protein
VTARPWRAVAYYPLPEGGRIIIARTSRATRIGLTLWLEQQRAAGFATDWWEVLPITGIGSAGQVAGSNPG